MSGFSVKILNLELLWCKAHGIRLSGPPLGRPKQDQSVQDELKQQARQDEKVRVWIEGKFGQAKRRFSLARVMAKLADTAGSAIAITFLVLNLERWLRLLLSLLFWLFALGLQAIHRFMVRYEVAKTVIVESTSFETITRDSCRAMSQLPITVMISV